MVAKRAPKGAHHRGDYHRRSRAVTAAARANPSTRCWRCGRTLQQHGLNTRGNPDWWTAGHMRDADPTSPLLPEANSCNVRAENQRRINAARRPTRRAQTALPM